MEEQAEERESKRGAWIEEDEISEQIRNEKEVEMTQESGGTLTNGKVSTRLGPQNSKGNSGLQWTLEPISGLRIPTEFQGGVLVCQKDCWGTEWR